MIITTIELYAPIRLLMTFDFYLGGKVSIMCKIGSFSTSGTAHVIEMKLGMDIKYFKYVSCIPVLFDCFAFKWR